ncbi:L-aspartate oxidase [Coxiella burnetii]|uniref:L-aspartate oxidase n=1 Tax=Coxiella burnetii TaxID=777 RepID=UPI0005098C7B|nr:L-aspartate oxidase [Coxiella burnetii]
MPTYDVLVIGSGAAGLGLALSLASEMRVAVLSKDDLTAGSSPHAQGGIAAVMNAADESVELHVQDTLNAGGGLCDPEAVRATVTQAKSAVEWLVQQGVQFTTDSKNNYHLTQEGGHSRRRILHAADKTGAVIVKTLAEQVLSHPNIDCFTDHIAIDLLIENNVCKGAEVYDGEQQRSLRFHATHTVLATGGASFAYLHTSNPNRTSGDGIAMAWRAGCRVANLEFNQFHPTCLYHPLANHYLITEVVRGEGGYLLLPDGKRFMPNYDDRAEMAPRDIVARAIDMELKKNNWDHVYLDISHRPADFIKKAFPTIYATCLNFGFDMTEGPLPVVPAAHYTCGGVMTDLQGQTDMARLYAIGEVAYTGLHGANRMASNSLLECLVFAASCARAIKRSAAPIPRLAEEAAHPFFSLDSAGKPREDSRTVDDFIHQVRKIMWDHVGIVRSDIRLIKAKNDLQKLLQQINVVFPLQILSKSLIELRNVMTVAQLVVESALMRKESRGLHYNVDYPHPLTQARNTILHLNRSPTMSAIGEKQF